MKFSKHFFVGAAILVATPLMLETPAEAQDWFKCNDGYELVVHRARTKVACRKRVYQAVNIKCPSGSFMGRRIGTRPQVKSGRDKCRGTLTVAGVSHFTEVDLREVRPQLQV